MKRLLSVISAGVLALFAFSCTTDEMVVFDPSEVSAPVLRDYTFNPGDEAIVANFTPAVNNLEFNQKLPVNHIFAIVKVGDEEVNKTVSSTVKDGTITLKVNNLNKTLVSLGKNMGDLADVELVIRATVQDLSKDNGINGYIDSQDKIVLKGYEIADYVKPEQQDPYINFTEESTWSVIGSIASTGNGWNQDEPMMTDGTWHVCRNLVLSTDDQFKFRKDAGWDTNYGATGDVEPFVVTLDEEFAAAAGGKNLAVAENGTYDLLLNPEAELIKIIVAVGGGAEEFLPDIDPSDYAEIDPSQAGAETWGIIGPAVSDWNTDVDLEMISDDPEIWRAKAVPFAADKFKFRGNDTWSDYDLGGGTFALDTPIEMSKGGGDMLAEAGCYDVWLYPTIGVAYLKVTDDPNPPTPPTPVEPSVDGVWTLVGSINGWSVDSGLESVDYGPWKLVQDVKIGFYKDDEGNDQPDAVKWVMDGSWDVNFGLAEAFAGLDVEQAVSFGGDNIVIGEEGSYDFYLDPNNKLMKVTLHSDEPLPEIFEYTMIGWWGGLEDSGNWGTDLELTKVQDGWYVAKDVPAANNDKIDFKFRHNKSWDDKELGAEFSQLKEVGVLFNLAPKGANNNIVLEGTGSFDVYLNVEQMKSFILVAGSEFAVPSKVEEIDASASEWSVVGVNGNWDKDKTIAMETYNGWEIARNVEMNAGSDFKFIKNHAWAPMFGSYLGGSSSADEKILLSYREAEADPDPQNLQVKDAGTYDLYLNTVEKIAYIINAGTPFSYWDEKWEDPAPPTEFVKVYIDNQTGLDAINIWAWDGFGSIVTGQQWPGVTLTETEEVEGKTWNVVSVDASKVKGQKCSFLICNTAGDWQTKDYSFTADETSLAYFFIAHSGESKVAEIEQVDVDLPETSAWSVIGSIASTGNGWNADEAMVVEGEWHICKGLVLATSDQFKFRKDADWGTNFGAPGSVEPFVVTLGEELEAVAGGKNLSVPEDGTYDLYLDPEAKLIKVVKN